MRRSVLLAAALVAVPSAARAADTWSNPYDGVRRLLRVTSAPAWRIHALVVDLSVPGVRFQATQSSQRKRTPSSFNKLIGAQATINADFFSYTDYSTVGLAVGQGNPWPGSKDPTGEGTVAFGAGNRIEFTRPVDLVCLVLLPACAGAEPLDALACVSRRLRDRDVLRDLRKARTPDTLHGVLVRPPAASR